MARVKPHIRIPSVEGQLGYPPDLVERYRALGSAVTSADDAEQSPSEDEELPGGLMAGDDHHEPPSDYRNGPDDCDLSHRSGIPDSGD
jgi:hypothetical protein